MVFRYRIYMAAALHEKLRNQSLHDWLIDRANEQLAKKGNFPETEPDYSITVEDEEFVVTYEWKDEGGA